MTTDPAVDACTAMIGGEPVPISPTMEGLQHGLANVKDAFQRFLGSRNLESLDAVSAEITALQTASGSRCSRTRSSQRLLGSELSLSSCA
jgi:hypothetical protein